ncbi:hypothetical protein BGZ63DRAFT_384871 [Mariannaea sp. PMI_226]|nr:hypothetical protein BGZ63DRAFT_384871 [Mariannaea sp. PMI_226]
MCLYRSIVVVCRGPLWMSAFSYLARLAGTHSLSDSEHPDTGLFYVISARRGWSIISRQTSRKLSAKFSTSFEFGKPARLIGREAE